MSLFRLPNDSQHTAIMGKNGSGKTRQGAWFLACSSFDEQPKIILDYKREELFDKVEHLQDITLPFVPSRPGIYRLRLLKRDDDAVDDWFYKVLDRENVGLYIDEGLQVPQQAPRYRGLQALLTQGRSKRCPVTILMQRPAWVSPFIFSESSFFSVFRMQADNDKTKISEFVPSRRESPLATLDGREFPIWDLDARLPPYYSRWFDEGQDFSTVLLPGPDERAILQRFYERQKLRRIVV
jgi:hypothetical protein